MSGYSDNLRLLQTCIERWCDVAGGCGGWGACARTDDGGTQ